MGESPPVALNLGSGLITQFPTGQDFKGYVDRFPILVVNIELIVTYVGQAGRVREQVVWGDFVPLREVGDYCLDGSIEVQLALLMKL